MLNKVLLIGNSILRQKCYLVDVSNQESASKLKTLLTEMESTMIAESGIGLAANQIGHSIRVFILKEENGYSEYINPEVISQEELITFEGEGCLSIPGTSANTKRFRKLKLKWTTIDGTNKEGSFEDLRAFAVQHEMDHIDGKLYVDQLGPLRKDMVLNKHRKFLRLSRAR